MWFYVLCSLVWFFSVYLEATSIRLFVLGEVGAGQIIYDVGGPTKANAGFYRAAEIAAWHVATASCFLFILLNGRRLSIPKTALVAVVVLFLVYVGLATGRRKMLVQIAIFGSTYLFLHAWFLRGRAKLAIFAIVAGIVVFGTILSAVSPDVGDIGYEIRDRATDRRDQFDAWKERGLTDLPRFQSAFHSLVFCRFGQLYGTLAFSALVLARVRKAPNTSAAECVWLVERRKVGWGN